MTQRRRPRWQYAGTAGGRNVGRDADKSPSTAVAVPRRAGHHKREEKRPAARLASDARREPRSGRRIRRLPGLGDVLLWTALAVVAGAFLGLLARQTWALALVAAVLVGGYVWRVLR